jgi:hypothetical protein
VGNYDIKTSFGIDEDGRRPSLALGWPSIAVKVSGMAAQITPFLWRMHARTGAIRRIQPTNPGFVLRTDGHRRPKAHVTQPALMSVVNRHRNGVIKLPPSASTMKTTSPLPSLDTLRGTPSIYLIPRSVGRVSSQALPACKKASSVCWSWW